MRGGGGLCASADKRNAASRRRDAAGRDASHQGALLGVVAALEGAAESVGGGHGAALVLHAGDERRAVTSLPARAA